MDEVERSGVLWKQQVNMEERKEETEAGIIEIFDDDCLEEIHPTNEQDDFFRVSKTGKDDPHSSVAKQDLHSSVASESNNKTDIDNGNDEVEVLTPQQVEYEKRRKRRRRLHRLLKKPGVVPSFLAIVTHDEENDSDDSDDGDTPITPALVIDVDEYLGLKAPIKSHNHSKSRVIPDGSVSSSQLVGTTSLSATTPAEEGWYEGVVSLCMGEDQEYLNELQQLIRSNLELFSATDTDARLSQAGRRNPAVRGRVGVRCCHCALAASKLQKNQPTSASTPISKKDLWPAGAISYPVNITGLYSSCSQKPQQHFENCPNLPIAIKRQFYELNPNNSRSSTSSGDGLAFNDADDDSNATAPKRRRMDHTRGGITAAVYYSISCRRIGIVELPGGKGMRFGRDISLEPLSFATIRAQVEQEQPHLLPKRLHVSAVLSDAKMNASQQAEMKLTSAASFNDAKLVLEKALAEPDNPSNLLARQQDKALVTDFMFLTIRQMALCHVDQMDLAARGKRAKSMRLGLAGFCCRHCLPTVSTSQSFDVNSHNDGQKGAPIDASLQWSRSCRYFSSAPDNLASAISNSLALHLQKCPYVPVEIQKASTAFKRVHSKQMQLLPHGSQRRLLHDIWSRLRAADLPEPETPGVTFTTEEKQEEVKPDSMGSGEVIDSAESSVLETNDVHASTTLDPTRENTRDHATAFPVLCAEETQKVLKRFTEDWDPSENDNLITPEDRHLVSDYVLLTMRQLRVAVPNANDFSGNRRSNVLARMAGVCCIHCHDKDGVTLVTTSPSGRSFPSAPDNMASTLNSSLYNHMQNCTRVPVELKQAFVSLRKIHSSQCSSLQFGSQRRFFNRVYEKLKQIPIGNNEKLDAKPTESVEESVGVSNSAGGEVVSNTRETRLDEEKRLEDSAIKVAETALQHLVSEYGFSCTSSLPPSHVHCLRCRMVPMDLRAPGSVLGDLTFTKTGELDVSLSVKTKSQLQHHQDTCAKDGIHLGCAAQALVSIIIEYKDEISSKNDVNSNEKKCTPLFLDGSSIPFVLFRKLVTQVVGENNHDLVRLFTQDILLESTVAAAISSANTTETLSPLTTQHESPQKSSYSSSTSNAPGRTHPSWRQLQTEVDFDKVKAAFEELAKELRWTSVCVLDHPRIIRWLQVISPWLQCPTGTVHEAKPAAIANNLQMNERENHPADI